MCVTFDRYEMLKMKRYNSKNWKKMKKVPEENDVKENKLKIEYQRTFSKEKRTTSECYWRSCWENRDGWRSGYIQSVGWLWPGNETFLDVANMVVTLWTVVFCAVRWAELLNQRLCSIISWPTMFAWRLVEYFGTLCWHGV